MRKMCERPPARARSFARALPLLISATAMLLMIRCVTPDSAERSAEGTRSPLASAAWVRLGGPIGGLGYDIRVQPDDPRIMYVTDAWAGVHKSIDGGATWLPANAGIDVTHGAVQRLDPGVLPHDRPQ